MTNTYEDLIAGAPEHLRDYVRELLAKVRIPVDIGPSCDGDGNAIFNPDYPWAIYYENKTFNLYQAADPNRYRTKEDALRSLEYAVMFAQHHGAIEVNKLVGLGLQPHRGEHGQCLVHGAVGAQG